MAQESWKKETDETECQTPEKPILCANNCGFFGSSSTMNFCSKCYRDLFMHQKQQQQLKPPLPLPPPPIEKPSASIASISVQAEEETHNKDDGGEPSEAVVKPPSTVTNRCMACQKRVGLIGFTCRCGGTFCGSHRYSESHGCLFDYRGAGREAIAKANPVVKADKVEKI
ncbi:Zinc finger A20 and AN1 domain-containing stress-associated protein 6 [Acorus gramineus]|uniref:Zinc finger A20 and AN1 domain-containing stress-associated protein 6 n=1 Tax=Acorus gramineus TaxID=55184 RepID=A0AAV9A0T2_ACOGR|nr:Zinc finger A20 and AN1 domain-containing stress-associated protein 6 [Acorus gramineus]